jgi:hypothetical protein
LGGRRSDTISYGVCGYFLDFRALVGREILINWLSCRPFLFSGLSDDLDVGDVLALSGGVLVDGAQRHFLLEVFLWLLHSPSFLLEEWSKL